MQLLLSDNMLITQYCRHRSQGCSPAVVVYGHYPLPVIAEPDTKPWRAGGAGGAKTGSLMEVLTQHGVTAYVSGHLHAVFGQRVHRLHSAPDGGESLMTLHPCYSPQDFYL